MGIEVNKLRSDNETYICNIENVISLNPAGKKKKAHYPYHLSERQDIDIMHILWGSCRKLAKSFCFFTVCILCDHFNISRFQMHEATISICLLTLSMYFIFAPFSFLSETADS